MTDLLSIYYIPFSPELFAECESGAKIIDKSLDYGVCLFLYKQCLDEFLYMFIISSEMVWIGICLVLETLFLFFHGKTFDG